MSRVYRFVPTIANHRVARMPHLVAMRSADYKGSLHHLKAARGVLIGGLACSVFWVVALSVIF